MSANSELGNFIYLDFIQFKLRQLNRKANVPKLACEN
jgi:hypothetical protein